MQFHVSSYRSGFEIMRDAGAFEELASAIESVTISQVESLRAQRQAKHNAYAGATGRKSRKAGVQDPLNKEFARLLGSKERAWQGQMRLYDSDEDLGKGAWTMDFHKTFNEGKGVGVEVCFNHGEALPWTLIRPTLAYQSEGVNEESRIIVAGIVLVTDSLKGNSKNGFRVDPSVGTYERVLTLIPRMKWVLPVPLVLFGLDWADGGLVPPLHLVPLHAQRQRILGA